MLLSAEPYVTVKPSDYPDPKDAMVVVIKWMKENYRTFKMFPTFVKDEKGQGYVSYKPWRRESLIEGDYELRWFGSDLEIHQVNHIHIPSGRGMGTHRLPTSELIECQYI